MKQAGAFSTWMACGVVAAVSLAGPAASAAESNAVVHKIQGTGSYAVQGGDFQSLNSDKVLSAGSTVRSGAGSHVDLNLGSSGVVRLLENTTLGITRLSMERSSAGPVVETLLDLREGTIVGRVGKLSAASRYEVTTPFGAVGIRAAEPTEFIISADGQVRVERGAVLVAYQRPTGVVTTHDVLAGQTFMPPAQPQDPQSPPTIAPSTGPRPEGPEIPTEPAPPVVLAPEPEPFISPTVGSAGGQ